MRFAVSLMRLLCAIIAGAVLVAFLYFTNQGAEYHAASTVCMVLFAASLAVWALIAVAGDMWLRKIDDRDFYNCQFACVVSNNSFTPSARKIANVSNVLLLNDNQIATKLDEFVG